MEMNIGDKWNGWLQFESSIVSFTLIYHIKYMYNDIIILSMLIKR